MIKQELLDYIKSQTATATDQNTIRQNLMSGGWTHESIDEAFLSLGIPVTPSNVPIHYAGFWIRFVAASLDSLLVGIVMSPLGFILGPVLKDSPLGGFGLFIIQIALPWIYFILMTNSKGATLGKMAVGIRVQSSGGEKLPLSKIIVRETIGKILSFVTIFIGYMMAGFTGKKQALHDKLAGSVVVYKRPGQKMNGWVIFLIVIVSVLPVIAIVGILSSVVLASLSVARAKGSDAQVNLAVASTTVASLYYLQEHNTFSGFKPQAQYMPPCSEPLITNISTDGKNIALFGKTCSKKDTYFCNALSADDTDYNPIKVISAKDIPERKLDCLPN